MKILKNRLIKKHIGFRYQLVLSFGILIILVGISITLGLSYCFTETYKHSAVKYIEDISRQTVNNMDIKIQRIEQISREILSNSIVQSDLRRVNTDTLTAYQTNLIRSEIRTELSSKTLFEDNISEISVQALNGERFQTSKILNHLETNAFSEREIREANGAALWGMTDGEKNCAYLTRAILDLNTMETLGYLTIICNANFVDTIIKNSSQIYTNYVTILDTKKEVIRSDLADASDVLTNAIWKPETDIVTFRNEDYYYYQDCNMSNSWTVITMVQINVIQDELAYVEGVIAAITIGCIAAGVAVIFLITRKMVKPLRILAESMEAIEAADFSKRIKITGSDEIGKLGAQYNKMAESMEKLIRQVYQMKLSQKQVEIELLKMQINPHFLYNTLDMINWMARMGQKDHIIDVTTALAKMLRANLKQDNFITVDEEMNSVQNYLKIQKYRFGDKISIEFYINDIIRPYIIPNFILQPLTENAIIHGLEPKVEKGKLTICGDFYQERLYFSVQDDGIGMKAEAIDAIEKSWYDKNYRDHIGLQNVYLRLKNYYGDQVDFKIKSQLGEGTLIEILMPVQRPKSHVHAGEEI